MTPKHAQSELERRINESGFALDALSPARGVRLMLDFYRDVRADDCALEGDGDMLLFQWGDYVLGDVRSFHLNITRQFMLPPSAERDDDDAITQLSLTFHFPLSPQLEVIKRGDRWCQTPGELARFEAFITGCECLRVVGTEQPERVTLDYSGV